MKLPEVDISKVKKLNEGTTPLSIKTKVIISKIFLAIVGLLGISVIIYGLFTQLEPTLVGLGISGIMVLIFYASYFVGKNSVK